MKRLRDALGFGGDPEWATEPQELEPSEKAAGAVIAAIGVVLLYALTIALA